MVSGFFRKRAKLEYCLLFTMASRTRDSMHKNGELFRRMLDERTAGLLLDADTETRESGIRYDFG